MTIYIINNAFNSVKLVKFRHRERFEFLLHANFITHLLVVIIVKLGQHIYWGFVSSSEALNFSIPPLRGFLSLFFGLCTSKRVIDIPRVVIVV